MKITAINVQPGNPDRVNVMVDGKFRFSLDIAQIIDLKVKVGKEYDDDGLAELENESQFGKVYTRALEYCLMRPHSSKEIRDYLYKKTLDKRVRNRRTGEIKNKQGVNSEITSRVYEKLVDKKYVNDERFARFWIENRNLRKGMSRRKLESELVAKGVDRSIINIHLGDSDRNDLDELQKIIAKKRSRYDDDGKFMQYLARQGFSYDDIKSALDSSSGD